MKTLLYLFLAIFILSCASSKESKKYPNERLEPIDINSINDVSVDGITVASKMSMDRKVIYDVFFSLESNQPDTVIKNLQFLTKSYQGYIVNSSKNNIKIRVPSNKSFRMIREIEALAKVVDKYISGQDVTEEYIDLEIKIDNLEKARKRYLELLAKAENVTAALRVEKELERLQRQLDLLKGREQKLSHLIDYVTIDIDVNIGVKPGPLGYVFVGLYKAIKWLFVW